MNTTSQIYCSGNTYYNESLRQKCVVCFTTKGRITSKGIVEIKLFEDVGVIVVRKEKMEKVDILRV